MTKERDGSAEAIALLEAMNHAIRTARYDEVEAFSAKLETNFIKLEQADRRTLERVRHLAQRNADCLTAAAQGLRAGRRRLVEIAAADRTDTYDRSGARTALAPHLATRRV